MFIDEVMFKLGITPDGSLGGDRVSVFSGRGVFVEGHKGIVSFSDSEIEIKLRGARLKLSGSGLSIKEINPDEIFIVGQVVSVVRE